MTTKFAVALFALVLFAGLMSAQTSFAQNISQTVTLVTDPVLGDGLKVELLSSDPNVHLFGVTIMFAKLYVPGTMDVWRAFDAKGADGKCTVYFWFANRIDSRPALRQNFKVLAVITTGFQAVAVSPAPGYRDE